MAQKVQQELQIAFRILLFQANFALPQHLQQLIDLPKLEARVVCCQQLDNPLRWVSLSPKIGLTDFVDDLYSIVKNELSLTVLVCVCSKILNTCSCIPCAGESLGESCQL